MSTFNLDEVRNERSQLALALDRKEIEILEDMDIAFKEDRARLFALTDGMRNTPKYRDRLGEIEAVCQAWRDRPSEVGYPSLKHPMDLPEWFPKAGIMSSWDDTYKNSQLEAFYLQEKAKENNQ